VAQVEQVLKELMGTIQYLALLLLLVAEVVAHLVAQTKMR
jgi:hypothetical protein